MKLKVIITLLGAVSGVWAMSRASVPLIPETFQTNEAAEDGTIVKPSGVHNYPVQPGAGATVSFSKAMRSKAVTSRIPALYGSIINDDNPDFSRPRFNFGLFRLPVETDGDIEMVKKDFISRYGGVKIEKQYYQLVMTGPIYNPVWKMRVFDTDTWEQTAEHTLKDQSLNADCLAAEPSTGNVYGCFYTADGKGREIGMADFTNRFRVKLRDASSDADRWNVCAFAPDGKLYAINMEGNLMRINLNTGKGTVIGSTGLAPYEVGAGTIDPESGRFFYVPYTREKRSALYDIDLQTGTATLISKLPTGVQFSGLCADSGYPDPKVPGLPTDIKGVFYKGNLQGEISFKAPSATYDSKSATGSLEYQIAEGTRVLATGTTSYGGSVSANVRLERDTIHDISINLINSVGTGPRGWLRGYFGNDTPDRPEKVIGVWDDNLKKFIIEWPAVTTGVHGGYMEPSQVTYELRLYPDSTVVSSGLAGTKASFDFPGLSDLKEKQIGVRAVFKDLKSEEERSNPAVGGTAALPYLEQFVSESVPDGYHIVNANRDMNTWRRYQDEEWLRVHKSPVKEDPLDDWLFTPPFRFEKGKSYQVAADLRSMFYRCVEKVEVRWGRNNTPESMANVGLDTLEFQPGGFENRYFMLTAPETGDYYIAFHAVSDPDQGSLVIDNISVSEPVDAGAPACVTDLTVLSGAKCAHYALLKFTAPSADIDGHPLSRLDSIEIRRNGEIAGTIKATPGEILSYRDDYRPGGIVEYEVAAWCDGKKGVTNRGRTFLGAYIPETVKDLSIVETSKSGEVRLTWSPPLRDTRAYEISPEYLTYNVYKVIEENGAWKDVPVKKGVEGTACTLQSCDEDRQEFAYYGVSAVSISGEGAPLYSEMIPVGRGYPLPFGFSFTPEDFNSYILGMEYMTGVWEVVGDNTVRGASSADDDDAYAIFAADSPGCKAAFFTGKIALPADTEPLMTFQTFKMETEEGGINQNTIELQANIGNGWETLKKVKIGDMRSLGWNRHSIPLGRYAGKSPRFRFEAECVNYPYMLVDALSVTESADFDLALVALEVPQEARINKELSAVATVQNNSAVEAVNFKVEILVDGFVRTSVPVASLEGGKDVSVPLSFSMRATDPESSRIQAKVVWEKDINPSNDISAEVTVRLGLPRMNRPSRLEVTENTSHEAVLSWEAPAEEGNIVEPVKDDFESYDSWQSASTGDWKFIDRDGGGIGGINGLVFPGGIVKGSVQSWWILDDRYESLNNTFKAHSGNKYIAQMYSADLSQTSFSPVTCDDWAVSPELFGCAQKISFYARSYSPKNLEKFDLMISSRTAATEDFELLTTYTDVPYLWHRYDIDLPDGTKYFAIRCTSYNEFMLHVDDVEYIPCEPEPFILQGYAVYRDGTKIADISPAGTAFIDKTAGGSREYCVTAVYNHGESGPSNRVMFGDSGVSGVNADNIIVRVSGCDIIVEGAQGLPVSIIRADGVTAFCFRGSGRDVRTVSQGAYLVKAGPDIVKVIVR